ncbi:MAG TPA: hypothetical protein VK988_15095 [Acidimicrobiales bacterium]|nr:hypothetical protein [Acidimicrobiales bacterium]
MAPVDAARARGCGHLCTDAVRIRYDVTRRKISLPATSPGVTSPSRNSAAVLARRTTGFQPFQWTGQEPDELNDEDEALALDAVWGKATS